MFLGMACAAALWFASPELHGFQSLETPAGAIYWRGVDGGDVDWARSEIPRAVARVEEKLGWRSPARFTTVLVPDRAELRRLLARLGARNASTQEALGVAFPARRLIVLRWDHVPPGESRRETLAHEVAHLWLHDSGAGDMPRWLDEGAAQWASGRTLQADEIAYLALLARMGSLYPLASMSRVFPVHHQMTSLAYQQSYLWLEFLAQRCGEDAVRNLFRESRRGVPVEESLARLTGVDVPRLERQYRGWIQAQASWGAAMASIVSLWTLAALLALAAIVRYVWRRRRRLREMGAEDHEDDEKGQAAAGSEEWPG